MASSAPSRHPSVLELLKEALPGEYAEDVIRRKAQAIVAKHSHWWKGPPFCPFELADLEGVIVQPAPEDIRSDGRIFPKGKDVYIQYRPDQCPERINFTICHELAHTLFRDCYKRERRRDKADKAEREFEDLCNIGASEFLFPKEHFLKDIGRQRLSALQIQQLAASYRASVDATARRYVHLYDGPACVVFACYKKPEGKSKTSLTVQYCVPNRLFPPGPHPNHKINSKSVANRAYSDKIAIGSARENWNVRGHWHRYRSEAIPLPDFQSKGGADVAIVLYPA